MQVTAALVALLLLNGCQYLDPPALYYSRAPLPAQSSAAAETLQDGESTTFSVLVYNVEGLAWPARSNRGPNLVRIGEALEYWRNLGNGPDIVLLQEAFSREAIAIAERSGYANALPGPSTRDRREIAAADVSADFKKARRRFKGERLGKRANSGLYILTDFPVLTAASQPFSRRACAGFDCLANKGILLARIQVPGTQAVIDVYNGHFNSRGATGVNVYRADRAHAFQVYESAIFLNETHRPANPIIYGGDFNTKHAQNRFDALREGRQLEIAHRQCIIAEPLCKVIISQDGDEPWLDTQDLQFYSNSPRWKLEPIRVQAIFDTPADGAKLSDHDGLMVTYRIIRTG
ncbi:endonuclease/exonuclease/phosphatase family protein [Croceicoccus esteveae]